MAAPKGKYKWVIGREANATIYIVLLWKRSPALYSSNDYLSQATQKSLGTKLLKTKEKVSLFWWYA